ncbi:MAG TPA: peptidoglycan-binding protein LysM [Casimicrobiaceae bacterium]|nr:peptidoglycan-binding protein LysM [Casimicrobiaceae bacterium]
MGLIDFVLDAGEKLLGRGETQHALDDARLHPDDAAKMQAANAAAADAILAYIRTHKLGATGLTVTFDAASATVSLYGVAPDQPTHEKIVLCAGNVEGVAHVHDMMSVDRSEPEAQFYTVRAGDTLAHIAQHFYGDASQYMRIYEANRPMLSSPDRIHAGETLRIPPRA